MQRNSFIKDQMLCDIMSVVSTKTLYLQWQNYTVSKLVCEDEMRSCSLLLLWTVTYIAASISVYKCVREDVVTDCKVSEPSSPRRRLHGHLWQPPRNRLNI